MRRQRRHLLLLVLVVATALSVAALPAVADAAGRADRGVVQRVGDRGLVLRALDGRVVAVGVDPRTRVFLNGSPAPLLSIRPGFVVVVVRAGGGTAEAIRAFGRVRLVVDGIVASVSRSRLELRLRGGGVESVPLTRATRVRRGSALVPLSAVRIGQPARVVRLANGNARLVLVRGRAGDRER